MKTIRKTEETVLKSLPQQSHLPQVKKLTLAIRRALHALSVKQWMVAGLLSVSPIVASAAYFMDSGQALGTSSSTDIALGDLNNDGYLDAFVTNVVGEPNRVWLNDGSGTFTDSGQMLGADGTTIGYSASTAVALGDVDGDGDLDAFVTNDSEQPNRVWLNDGTGVFSDSGQNLGNASSQDVALGDVNGDGYLDAFVANATTMPLTNRVWLNDGSGNFTDSGQASLGNSNSLGVTLGDVDNDGDLDALIANSAEEPNRVWLNDGSGIFTDSTQDLGTEGTPAIALGDVDGDGNPDAVVANEGANRVWFNTAGMGIFIDSGQNLGTSVGNSNSRDVMLGDVDGDSDLDIFVVNNGHTNRVWMNDGTGTFSDSAQDFGSMTRSAGALGDVDGDGDLDAFIAVAGGANKVWFNLPARMSSPSNGSTLAGHDVTFSWEGDPVVQAWWVYVGSFAGAADYFDSGSLSTTSVQVTSLPVDGSPVFVRLWYNDGSQWAYLDYTYTAATVTAMMSSPTNGSTLAGPDVTFTWQGAGLPHSWLYVGTSAGLNDLFDSGDLGGALTVDATGLPVDGSQVFVRLWYDNGSGWQYNDYTYTAHTVVPAMTSPTNGSTLTGSSMTFNWQGAGVQHWWLVAGSATGRFDYFNSGDLGTTATVDATGLPVDGSAVYVRLWYHNGSIWQYLDYSYTAHTVVPTMTSPTDGSTLSGPDVTFNWQGDGVQQWWLYLGSVSGTKNLYDSGSLSGATTSANVTGLPQNGSTVYARLWYNDGSGVWKKVDLSYTAVTAP